MASSVQVGADAGSDAAAPASITCDDTQLAACMIGVCTLTAPRGTLPAGAKVTLSEQPLPSDAVSDALGSRMCDVLLPDGITQKVTLTVSGAELASPDSVLFRRTGPDRAYLVTASTANDGGVSGLVAKSGSYGVTRRPGAWQLESILGAELQTSESTSARLRNIATRGVQASFYDGTRLYVGNGSRLLVYLGVPASPDVKPAIVLGEPDLDTPTAGVSSASFGGTVRAIWSNGTKLVVGTGSRVLVWNAIPRTSFTPADFVLGQADFSSQTANAGGVSGASISSPRAFDSDGNQLLVADMTNNRVLGWSPFPDTNGQSASFVIGQPSLNTNVANGGAVSVYYSSGVAFVPGGAFVANTYSAPGVVHVANLGASNPAWDFALGLERRTAFQANTFAGPGSVFRTPNNGLGVIDASWRIAMFRSVPTTAVSVMDFVLGMPDATRSFDEPISSSSLETDLAGSQTYAASSDTMLTVANGYRVLAWDKPPTYSFEPASRVIGQAGFSTNRADLDYRRTSAATLAGPADIAISGTRVAVADRDNNRVLLFDTDALGTVDPAATVVLGQSDASSYIPNLDQQSPDATRLSAPSGLAFAGARLVVADTENHRVLIWNTIPSTSGAPADIVLGQTDFAGRRPNRNRGDTSPKDGFSDAAGDGMFYPAGVASDGTHLFVADRLNNRVLVWSTFPTASGQPADAVIGQPNMTALLPNRGLGRYHASPNGFNLPSRLLLDGTTLWVADTENNRVVRVDNATTSPNPTAFLGQVDGSSISNLPVFGDDNYSVGYPIGTPPPSTTTSVLRPQGLAMSGGLLYVSELTSNRVHAFDRASLSSVGVLGQSGTSTGTANAGGVSAASLSGPLGIAADGDRLLIADSNNHRIVGHSLATPPATGARATILLGQTDFLLNGFNQSVPVSAGGGSRPRGIVRDGDELYVAQSDFNRVVVTKGDPSPSAPIAKLLGQPNDALRLANSGGGPSSRTLQNPRDVAVDTRHVAVADTGNHRVLVYPRDASTEDATVVVGQNDFDAISSNRNGAISAATLSAPQGVLFDQGRLFVADTGNNRVLIWSSLPTVNGQAADIVLGQADASAHLTNNGQSTPTGTTMSLPVGMKIVGTDLYVADSGNNRVLRFDTKALVTGAAASAILGQTDAVSRTTVADAQDASRLAGPTGLAADGARLYVADRDLSRVVIFSLDDASVVGILGAPTGVALSGVSGVSAERTPFFTTRLYAADTNANRTLTITSLSRLSVDD